MANNNLIKFTNTSDGLYINSNINDVHITGTSTISDVTFTGQVIGITKEMVGLDNVDNTSDLNKPVSIPTQNELNTKLSINNPIFTGKCIGPSVELENITINGIARINTLLYKFIKIDAKDVKLENYILENNYILQNTYTNIAICGTDANNVTLPSNPIDGMTINIKNLSKNDLLIYSHTPMYNLLLAPTGLLEIPLQQNFMYTFTYNEDLNNKGNWYLSF
jgi:hypothetical protein